MNALFISPWYPNKYDSMLGLFVRKHAEAVGLYANVKVLYVHPDKNIKKTEIVVNQQNNIEEYIVYYPVSGKSFFSKIKKTFRYFKAYKKGVQLLTKKDWKPDIIQANIFTRTAFIAYLLKLKYGIPYAVIEHWTKYFRPKTFRNPWHKYLSRFVARKASAVMPVTHHLKQCMEAYGMKNNNYQVINNVVDDIFFKEYPAEKKEKVQILNVTSSNDAHKNITGILRTIERLSQKRTDFEMIVIGDGADFDQIKAYEKSLNIASGVVRFTGLLEGHDLVKMYKACDFTILFSNFENIPVVISESFVCGKPVISTDVGGIKEHIHADNGILIKAKDEEALLNSIDWMIDNYKKYNSEKIAEEAYQKYSYEHVGKELTDIYTQILRK